MIKLKKKPAMVCVIKKEEDFIPFQQTFVNVSDTKEEEIYNVADFSESDQQTFVNVSDSKKDKIFVSEWRTDKIFVSE